MSIAVSAVIRPSASLRLPAALFCAATAASAVLCEGVLWPLACMAAGVGALAFLPARTKARRLDISAVGQIRLAVYQQGGDGGAEQADSVTFTLLAGSTLWPGLLLLRLAQPGAAIHTLAFWPGPAWRPLAVAARAIAARGTEAERS